MTSKHLPTCWPGTPHYLSPEICKRQPYNHKSDMWSLGCVIYELCALSLAFPADNFISLVQSICRGHYKPIPASYSSKVSDLSDVLMYAYLCIIWAVQQMMLSRCFFTHLYRLIFSILRFIFYLPHQVSDLIQVLLRPMPEKRPSAEQLLTCR